MTSTRYVPTYLPPKAIEVISMSENESENEKESGGDSMDVKRISALATILYTPS